MRKIRGKNTTPEIVVRRIIRSLGFGYRLYERSLPGQPDIVFKGRKKVIFIHGCFWHQHPGCKVAHLPKSNLDYWLPKLRRTQERDRKHLQELEIMGWTAMVVWECELTSIDSLGRRLLTFLEGTRRLSENMAFQKFESEKWE